MGMCEFPISAPGLLHLSTLLIGTVCLTLGCMSSHASWVNNDEYRLCETYKGVWKTMKDVGDVHCPDISLETAFLIMTAVCLATSLFWYSCHVCCFGSSKTAGLFYVLYLTLAAVTLIIAGILYIKSAVMIANLPGGADYAPMVKNFGRVLAAAFKIESADDMQLAEQSQEQTYYEEKIATGILSIINGALHILCAWLAVLDVRH